MKVVERPPAKPKEPKPQETAKAPKPAATLKRSNGHHRDWIDACKGGEPASSHFGYGAHLTELAHLGNLSLRLKRPIEWDAANLRFPNHEAANAFDLG